MTLSIIYLIGRSFYTHKELKVVLNRDSDFLWFIVLLGILMTSVLFVTFCAVNNTFWNLPYLTK